MQFGITTANTTRIITAVKSSLPISQNLLDDGLIWSNAQGERREAVAADT